MSVWTWLKRYEAGLLWALGLGFLLLYFRWQSPLTWMQFAFVINGWLSWEAARIISIFFVAVCPYACLTCAAAKWREGKGHRSLKLWFVGGVLGFIGGAGYPLSVLYKEITVFHFSSWVLHDYFILALHFPLLAYSIGVLVNLTNYTINRIWILALVLGIIAFIFHDIEYNPWLNDNRPLAFLLTLVLMATAFLLSKFKLFSRP